MINRTGRTMLAVAAGVVLVATATTAAQATTATGAQGGYAASATIQSARVALHAPKVNCAAQATKPGSLRLGLFGSAGGQTWYLAIIASCHGGQARYRAEFSENVGQPALIVHRGDLVRLSIKPGPEYEIEDVTTGEGEGGASASSGGPPSLRQVVIGAHVQGTFPAGTHATMRAAKINRKPLAEVAHQRQAQQRDTAKLVVAGPLNKAGSGFTVTFR